MMRAEQTIATLREVQHKLAAWSMQWAPLRPACGGPYRLVQDAIDELQRETEKGRTG